MTVTEIWPGLEQLLTCLKDWGLKVQPQLVAIAVTHSSYAHEKDAMANERLEFLGDAVLELVVSEYLFANFPAEPEGELTRRRAMLVCESTLARCAQRLNLGPALRLGRGEEAQGGRYRPALLADAVEAILGAVYLSAGLEGARSLVMRLLVPYLTGEVLIASDYKTTLQEQLQAQGIVDIEYRLMKSQGPAHARQFTVGLFINNCLQAQGCGHSKKEAEQRAANNLLRKMSK
ncbi:MAG TPA: ribonuclease III [Firmicutes bacterium]|nr:ribonuclease III [Bacillota bacterium]